jgi:hypothetical protein
LVNIPFVTVAVIRGLESLGVSHSDGFRGRLKRGGDVKQYARMSRAPLIPIAVHFTQLSQFLLIF